MSKLPIRVLLIEDNPGDARLLQEMLDDAPGNVAFELEHAERLSAGLKKVARNQIDVVLLDLTLPDSEGLETFIRLQTEAPDMPITVLSGLDDASLAIQAVRDGAQDYLVKGEIDNHSLTRAIRYAIERKQAEKEIRRRTAYLEALNAVVAAATTAPDLANLLEIALQHTLQALDLDRGMIWQAEQCVTRGLPADFDLAGSKEALNTGLDRCGPITVMDWEYVPSDDALSELAPRLIAAGAHATLAVPILVESERIGGLAAIALEPHPWPADEIALAKAVGKQVGAAARRLRLLQAEREQRELAEALQEAAATVSDTLEAEKVLDRILEQVERVVPGDAFNVMLLSEDGDMRIARWRGYERPPAAVEGDEKAPFDRFPSLQRMANTGEPTVVPDTTTDPDWIPLEEQGWLRSYVGAPIRVGGVTVGFLNVSGQRPGQFTEDDAKRLQAFASQAATAIQNAHLYRELLTYAEELEQRVQERTAQLQAQYARLQAILHSSSDGIIVADSTGAVLQTNPVAQTWLNRTLSPDDAAKLRQAVRALAPHVEERPEMVLELTGMDLELSAAPITEPGMESAAAVIAIHDVSHLKALDRMKSRFVSNVSHELRTPITTIKLYAELMQRSPPEKLNEYLEVLAQEADRQARLVEDILQISRIDSGRLEIGHRPTPLNDLTDMVVLSSKPIAEEKALILRHKPGEPTPIALIDPERTTQVLTNLVMNAIQYTPEGGQVTVSTAERDRQGRTWATVTVADTGIGIPENELPHIFERFFRGKHPQDMQTPGTGLGLAIVKEIVELQGGVVTVNSTVGEGTSVTVWLPLVD